MQSLSKRNYLVGYIILMTLALVCLFFPFRIENQHGGTYPTLFGVGTARSYTDIKSGFEIPIVFIELGLMLITASLMIFSGKRVFKILSLITLFFVVSFTMVLYFALTFQLNFFGPSRIITVGSGFILLLLVIVLFTAFTIYIFVKTFRSSETKKEDNDLLDDMLTS